MISRNGNGNFFVAHFDWIALAVGIVALVAGAAFYAMSLGADQDEMVASAEAGVTRMKPAETGVKAVDMAAFESAASVTRKPLTMADVSESGENFLASERRVKCKKCEKAIPGDIRVCPACPFCGEKQEEEKKVVLDADGDGLPDEWEKRYKFNTADASDANGDADGDGFTNLEEFLAKTDPRDGRDHPDYRLSLKLQLPLKETHMPFIFTAANKIPSGWRCEFYFPNSKDDSGYGRKGLKTSAVIGEEIAGSGFVLKGYEKKETKRAIKGGQGLMKTVDVSEVTVVRKSDSREIKLVIAENLRAKTAAVDVQATLLYERGTVQTFEVVAGSEIKLNNDTFKVGEIKTVGKKVTVAVINARKEKDVYVVEALEQ